MRHLDFFSKNVREIAASAEHCTCKSEVVVHDKLMYGLVFTEYAREEENQEFSKVWSESRRGYDHHTETRYPSYSKSIPKETNQLI